MILTGLYEPMMTLGHTIVYDYIRQFSIFVGAQGFRFLCDLMFCHLILKPSDNNWHLLI